MAKLEHLQSIRRIVDLENVKQQVRDLIDYNQIQHLRVKSGLKKSNKTLHMELIGNVT